MACKHWTIKKAQAVKKFTRNTTVKVGYRDNNDEADSWYFMIGEDPGNAFYADLFRRYYKSGLADEFTADLLEGLLGIYHGLKRVTPNRIQKITGAIGNIMHFGCLWLQACNTGAPFWEAEGWDNICLDSVWLLDQ